MFNVEQFIYTTASIENKKGYQVVAKSKGITDEIISDLESYVYPIDVEPSKFNNSRSFVLLKKDLAAYSRIKNIGLGNDGRENTLYNHTFIFSKIDFEKQNCDSRIFDKFYLEDKSIRGILPTLSISSSSQSFSSIPDVKDIILEKILKALFTKKKIALLINNTELPQKIISLLPKSMRIIPFSTFIIEPKKQPKYDFILNPELKKSKIEKDFEVISIKETQTIGNKTHFEQSIRYYVRLIKIHKYDELKKIHKLFEEIPGSDYKNKLILLSNYLQFQASNEKERERYAENALETLKQFDHDTFLHYFGKIKDSMKKYRDIEEKLSPEVNPTISFIDTLFLLPTRMMMNVYKAFSEQQTEKDTD